MARTVVKTCFYCKKIISPDNVFEHVFTAIIKKTKKNKLWAIPCFHKQTHRINQEIIEIYDKKSQGYNTRIDMICVDCKIKTRIKIGVKNGKIIKI